MQPKFLIFFVILLVFLIIPESFATHISKPILEMEKSEFTLGENIVIKGWIEYSNAPATDVLVNVKLSGPNQNLLYDEFTQSNGEGKFSKTVQIPNESSGNYIIDVISFCKEEHRNICTYQTTQKIIAVMDSENIIPSWIKNNAGWWAKGAIDERDFLTGIEHLVKEGIIQISQTSAEKNSVGVPHWVKNTALWWSEGLIPDSDFVAGIEFLAQKGMIRTSSVILSSCMGNAICEYDTVTRVVDGDTIYTSKYKIRISLTNTPEINESGFAKASEFTRNLCPVGSSVLIDQDDNQKYDVYNRMLAAIYCGDKLLNSELLHNGHASILTNYCSTSEFANESWAKQYGCDDIYQEPKQAQKETKLIEPKETKCDPSYPDVCIAPYPPDLNCKDVPYKNFRVIPPDPHRFDADKDGIGCEK